MTDTGFQKDEHVFICHDHGTITGQIVIVSPNSVSLVIRFDAIIGKHAGAMPLLLVDEVLGTYRSMIDGTMVIIQKRKLH